MKRAFVIPALTCGSFVTGLLMGRRLVWTINDLFLILFICFCLLLLLHGFRHKAFVFRIAFLILTAVLFIGLGLLRFQIARPEVQAEHYLRQEIKSPAVYTMVVSEVLKPTAYQNQYVAKLQSKAAHPIKGRILVKIGKDSVVSPLKRGDEVMAYADLTDLPSPLNPHQFDYAKFMANREIYKEMNLSSSQSYVLLGHHHSLQERAAHIRADLEERLTQTSFSADEKALIAALVLGQRADLSDEVYQSFIDAGVVHVLAISGLHVGILLGLLLVILKPLTRWKHGALIRAVVVVLSLWLYAFLTGLSPSVLRAVTMFSFLSLGLKFNRRVFAFNMLGLSAIVLLMIQPRYVFEVGFQLSYSAVLAILVFQEKLFRMLVLKVKILRYLWRISCVTISAQLGVLPLSLFYFHQFPGLFFVSNLLIIPFMGIVLGFGILVMSSLVLGIYSGWIFTLYSVLLQVLLSTVRWISQQTDYRFEHVYFSSQMLILSLLCLVLLAMVLHHSKKLKWGWLFVGLLGLQGVYIGDYYTKNKVHQFYVFHKTGYSVMGWQKGHALLLSADWDLKEESTAFLKGFLIQNDLTKVEFAQDSLRDFYKIGSQNMWIIKDAETDLLPPSVSVDIILLRNSPPVNLERILRTHRPVQLLADGSNFKSDKNRWEKTAQQWRIPFHYTGDRGYFSLDLSPD